MGDDCSCCVGGVTPEVVYVKISGALGSGACLEACDDIEGVCFALTRTGACSWQGTGPTHPTCYPTSAMALTMSCVGGNTTITALWVQNAAQIVTSRVRWKHTFPGLINCTACQILELEHDTTLVTSTGCSPTGSHLKINFLPFSGCCHTCPSQYQVTFAGFDDPDPEFASACPDPFCLSLNGTYLLDFVESGLSAVNVGGSFDCVVGSEWCLYETESFARRCQVDNDYGVCKLRLYVKTTDTCGTDVVVVIMADTSDDGQQCAGATNTQGWKSSVAQSCTTLDATFNTPCADNNWPCDNDGVSVRVQAM